jgi:hypothetical protein
MATAAAVVLLATFAGIAVSVVGVRRTLDTRVSKSFDGTVATLGDRRTVLTPHGCRKLRLYWYSCSAGVRHRRTTVALVWNVLLQDDGCWHSFYLRPNPLPALLGRSAARLGRITGCGA